MTATIERPVTDRVDEVDLDSPPPRPPRRVPKAPRERPPMTPTRLAVRAGAMLLATALVGLVGYLTVFSQLSHVVDQQHLGPLLRTELAKGVAPVSEGTVDGVLLSDGAPVAQLRIPQIGVDETVVEGTRSGTLTAGPGHRRDTVLPGQAGVSVLMGRAAAFGGPFGRIQELAPGDRFTVVTGQGVQEFEVIGVRYAGDLAPAYQPGHGRLVLESARGPAFMPGGVVRVDADLVSQVQPVGTRQTTFASLTPAEKELAGDSSHAWALLLAVQFLLVVELGAVWAYYRIGRRQAWIVFVSLVLLAALMVADQITRLLPNLL